MQSMAGTSIATISIRRQSSQAIAAIEPSTTMPESSITYSTWR